MRNEEFARNVCRYAIGEGRNPYAMHLFFTQFLDDRIAEHRDIGIACGLEWTDLADEVWFCLREGDRFSSGMQRALERYEALGRRHFVRCIYFTQQGERIRDTDIETMTAQA